jgi:hypothetical protein
LSQELPRVSTFGDLNQVATEKPPVIPKFILLFPVDIELLIPLKYVALLLFLFPLPLTHPIDIPPFAVPSFPFPLKSLSLPSEVSVDISQYQTRDQLLISETLAISLPLETRILIASTFFKTIPVPDI